MKEEVGTLKAAAIEAEMNEKLRELEKYYGEPVMPVSQYCKAFRTWAECLVEADKEAQAEGKNPSHGLRFVQHLPEILLAIQKSNLLFRLIYMKLPARKKKCPVHKGSWSGCVWGDDVCECVVGSNVTGWLPDDEEGEAE